MRESDRVEMRCPSLKLVLVRHPERQMVETDALFIECPGFRRRVMGHNRHGDARW
jgi:hypothetical protein